MLQAFSPLPLTYKKLATYYLQPRQFVNDWELIGDRNESKPVISYCCLER